MKHVIYYDRESRVWWGYWASEETGDQIGEAISSHNKEDCLIQLGMIYGDRHKTMLEAGM